MEQRQVDLVDDLGEGVVGYGGCPRMMNSSRSSTTAMVATPWMQCLGAQLTAGHSAGQEDFDLASYGVVKVHLDRPGLPWERKDAFATVGEYYRTH